MLLLLFYLFCLVCFVEDWFWLCMRFGNCFFDLFIVLFLIDLSDFVFLLCETFCSAWYWWCLELFWFDFVGVLGFWSWFGGCWVHELLLVDLLIVLFILNVCFFVLLLFIWFVLLFEFWCLIAFYWFCLN